MTRSSAERELTVTRVFDAPRRLVFKMWTAPEHAARWWGPQGHDSMTCTMDVRPGGTWERRMRAPDGGRYRKFGVYREVVPPERLVFTYMTEDSKGEVDHETLVTVTFEEVDGKTRLTLHQAVFETVELRAAHHGGWTSCFERFAAYIATQAD
jgi:uncharacterized protein YndB with AHSA1/START domain